MDPPQQIDERKLVEQARQGDRDAFRQLVVKYQRRAYAVALGMLHDPDEARDVCQEAFFKAHRNLASFEGGAQFFTWLYRIVANLCIDTLRKRRGDKLEFDDTIGVPGDDATGISPRRLGFDPQRALNDKELRGRITDALGQLSAAHRSVLVLREVEGLSYQEIADSMACSIGTVMSRLFHARKRMQSMLLEFHDAPPAGAAATDEDEGERS